MIMDGIIGWFICLAEYALFFWLMIDLIIG
jgi:hypothetical protein